jgi:ABC-type lipoprotein export system ATPase subunit
MSFIVSCQSVSKTYGEGSLEVHAVRHLNLDVNKGEFLSLSNRWSGQGQRR